MLFLTSLPMFVLKTLASCLLDQHSNHYTASYVALHVVFLFLVQTLEYVVESNYFFC